MIHREMAYERERGKELASIVASDKNFVKELENVKGKKLPQLISYLAEKNLFTTQNPLTTLSLGMCVYTLETKYKVDMGCGDWKLTTDEEFLREMDKRGRDGLAEITPGSNIKKLKGKKNDYHEGKDG